MQSQIYSASELNSSRLENLSSFDDKTYFMVSRSITLYILVLWFTFMYICCLRLKFGRKIPNFSAQPNAVESINRTHTHANAPSFAESNNYYDYDDTGMDDENYESNNVRIIENLLRSEFRNK